MKIFISWSGNKSRESAVILREWLKCVLAGVVPFVSSEDIRKGKRWLIEISKELQDSSFGIICLTPENLESPWILFEAGALSKFSDAQVTALLLGELSPSGVTGPLSHFQATPFKKDHVKKLVNDINSLLGEKKLALDVIERVFEKWWPDLERDIATCFANKEKLVAKRSVDSMVEEVLELTRRISKGSGAIPPIYFRGSSPQGNENYLLKLSDEGAVTSPAGSDWNHPVAVTVGPVRIPNSENYHKLSITHTGVETLDLGEKAASRGVTVEVFFHSEQGHFWSLQLDFHKGLTYGKTRLVADEEALRLALPDTTIWRD